MSSSATGPKADELFRQALAQFESMIRMGVKIQEETVKLLLGMMRDPKVPQDWVKRTLEVVRHSIPASQKSAEESIRVMNDNAQASLAMLEEALEAIQSSSMIEAQTKTREMWETALGALRGNMQAITQANARAVEAWEQLLTEMGSAHTNGHP